MKKQKYKIAVVGNPNSGKTCLFNGLTGASQHVGNYPGITVEFVSGESDFHGETVKITDLPGIYSMTAYSQEEIVSRDHILNQRPDLILNVVDASNLERNLYLTAQLVELNIPMVIALNMIDIADRKGIAIDYAVLSSIIGAEAVPTIASRKYGFSKLKNACINTIRAKKLPHPTAFPHELESVLPELEKAISGMKNFAGAPPVRWIALKLLEDDQLVLENIRQNSEWENISKALQKAKRQIEQHSHEDSPTAVAESRHAFAAGVIHAATQMSENARLMLSDRIDRIVCNRFLGPVILCAVVYSLFIFVFQISREINWIPQFNGVWTSPTGLLELFFAGLNRFAGNAIELPWMKSLICDGVISGVGSVMSFVPLIFFMFLFISTLEDSGYIARVAFIMDRLLKMFGLQGKSILAMLISGGLGAGGCAVPGVMAARALREEKDRLITILVAPFMNCGAKMPVYAMLIAAFFSSAQGTMMFLLWMISWGFALGSALVLRKTIIRGEQTPFVMELPVYHLPTLNGILIDTWSRTYMYIKKAATVILAVNLILWALMYYPRYDAKPLEDSIKTAGNIFISQAQYSPYPAIFASGELENTIKFLKNYAAPSKQSEHLAELTRLRQNFASELESYKKSGKTANEAIVKAYAIYQAKITALSNQSAQQQLRHSFAGMAGAFLTPATSIAGFDWKENIALIGGLAAKEVILGTLGTAYAMGETAAGNSTSISQRLAEDPGWSRVRAFAMLVFVMAYAPCLATLATIKKETGKWRWAAFSAVYSTVLAFIAAAMIYQIGSIF
jgi:ferrous iron transport protein B